MPVGTHLHLLVARRKIAWFAGFGHSIPWLTRLHDIWFDTGLTLTVTFWWHTCMFPDLPVLNTHLHGLHAYIASDLTPSLHSLSPFGDTHAWLLICRFWTCWARLRWRSRSGSSSPLHCSCHDAEVGRACQNCADNYFLTLLVSCKGLPWRQPLINFTNSRHAPCCQLSIPAC